MFPYRRPLSFLLSTDVDWVFNLPNDPCACCTHDDETRTEGCRLGRTGKRFFTLSRPGVEPRALDLKSCALASQRRPESVYIYVASQEYGLYLHYEATLQNTRLVGTVFICTTKRHCKTRGLSAQSLSALRSDIAKHEACRHNLYLHCEASLQNTRLVGTVFICTVKRHCKTRGLSAQSLFALRSYIVRRESGLYLH